MIGRELELTPGETFTIARLDLSTEPALTQADGEKSLWRYFQALAEEPSIEGVAFSRTEDYGYIYTTFFVRGNNDAIGRALRVSGQSHRLLSVATDGNTSGSSFIHLGERTFEEGEARYRSRLGQPDPLFGLATPKELLGIVRFI